MFRNSGSTELGLSYGTFKNYRIISNEFDMIAMEVQTNQYLGGDSLLACMTETQKMIGEKVVELVRKQHEKVAQILLETEKIWILLPKIKESYLSSR